ncbi:hypothetical protein ELE36_12830 [Pseudolysobacter antarcticus]|uniref:Uncharacterized protein n=1 Tax=Pseudolysobacter antarcticus TaxID=2511995 RepID=A0A411HL75_9GAMM|nr:hypothetical protein [Pseudolysobacter antarcticus]QBB71164.1 hypothetical protein ELE36_12830 [Pseudolysobacter antarcticus]
MQDQSIYSSGLLLYVGEPIEFKLEEREQSISGTFGDDFFHSRWAGYGRGRVGSWRSLDRDRSAQPVEAPIPTGSFARFFKRLRNITSPRQGSDLITPPSDIAEISAVASTTLPASKATAHAIHSNPLYSNQMSS